ncbi:helix-turn-helix domain-containing protein [Clostridium chromiireducens]|uniref:Helix-turn-helix domain-containing protein n=1 Tax=Clostridium chromiireducens TaxID=225345 RepID=A0A964RK78_9CLOT|nr:helix-turn-helix domain-containing protein [Clostridium chromiireducens]MVX63123.1 helix-turn-helix domain-containing protein [Clostridium chromiireducens]
MQSTISERIKKGLEIRGMKQSELVEKTGIGKSSISTYISGAYEPKQKNIYKIAEALDVNEAWLMGADVPMEKIDTTRKSENNKEELKLLNNYNKLNLLGKIKLIEYSNDLIENSKYTEIENNQTNLVTIAKKEPKSLEEMYKERLAAHDDDLTEEEKKEMDRRIMEVLKKKK